MRSLKPPVGVAVLRDIRTFRAVTDKRSSHKIKALDPSKESTKKIKRQATEEEKMCAKHTPFQWLVTRTYKELSKFNKNRNNSIFLKYAKI